jgi:hypothetical protein|nr:MAG TPA: Mor transcription activator family [Caudoviricetes sp.]
MVRTNARRDMDIVIAIDAGVSRKSLAEKYGISVVRIGDIYRRAKREVDMIKYNTEKEELKIFLKSIMPIQDDDLLNFISYKFFNYYSTQNIDEVKDLIYITIYGIIGSEFIQPERLRQLKPNLFNKNSLIRNGCYDYRQKIISLLS